MAIRKPNESEMFTSVDSAPSRGGVAVAAPERVVFEPHKAGIPKIEPYVDALWKRRHFAAELSKSTMRAAHSTTFFGRLWLVLNPTLNAAVYYLLVVIIAGSTGTSTHGSVPSKTPSALYINVCTSSLSLFSTSRCRPATSSPRSMTAGNPCVPFISDCPLKQRQVASRVSRRKLNSVLNG